MEAPWRRMLACPGCSGTLDFGWRCTECGMQFAEQAGIPMLRLPADPRTEVVREFYSEAPFPGYPSHVRQHYSR